jgi:hypothetical protein
MIAVELADALGADLGFESLDGLWDEIERVAPAHRGITRALLAAPGRVDGIVVGRQDADPAVGARTAAEVAERDPSATEFPAMVLDGASRSVGLRIEGGFTVTPVVLRTSAEPPSPSGAEEEMSRPSGDAEQEAVDVAQAQAETTPPDDGAPPVKPWAGPRAPYATPVLDAYSLRLVATRALYDESVSIRHSPSLAGLAREVVVRLHPGELERIGVASGDRVRVSSNRTSLTLVAIADTGVPRGAAAIEFNLPGLGAADLIDAAQQVTDVRVETT